MPIIEVILRIFFAIFFGGILGAERAMKKKPAGFVTLTLVSLGAALVAILQQELTNQMNGDVARLTAQVISGVGFIGGGTIVYNKGSVHGITTAALLWISACLGLVIGYGFFKISFISFAGVLIVLFIMRSFEKHYIRKESIAIAHLKLYDKKDLIRFIELYQDSFIWDNFQIKDIKPLSSEESSIECSFRISEKITFEELQKKLLSNDLISEVKLIF